LLANRMIVFVVTIPAIGLHFQDATGLAIGVR